MNSTRLSRKNRTSEELGLKGSGGIPDCIDNAFKEAYRLTDDEYDFVCEQAEDDVLDVLVVMKDEYTFSEKRNILLTLQNIIKKWQKN